VKFRLLLLPFALAACAQAPEATGPAPSTTTTSPAPPNASASSSAAAAGNSKLVQYHWQLTNAIDSKGNRIDALFVRADKPVQLDFSPDRLNVVNSCNSMGSGYTIKKGQLQIGSMMSTMMACGDPSLAALDNAISQRLQGTLSISMLAGGNAPHLQLITANGDTLSFSGAATGQTRFGGPGETAFLEVAAQTAPCNSPLTPNRQCLLVREIHYDEHGLPTGTPGAWQPLNQDIEGYTHTPGIRNVLRVKRFTVANPPTDGSSIAYVLDLVVESEQVQQ
jgi:heat shock protein HslJ